MDRGAWRATVYRVEKSWTLLSDIHFISLQLNVAPSHKVLSGYSLSLALLTTGLLTFKILFASVKD